MFRLPTKDEFKKLFECYTKFDNERKGRFFYDEETGEHLFLPCKGYKFEGSVHNADFYGHYWTSNFFRVLEAYNFIFNNRRVDYESTYMHMGSSVRLVSDEPFEGAIHVAGLYWKSENEEGYYEWKEAMKKFNRQGGKGLTYQEYLNLGIGDRTTFPIC